jgi:superfamily II DNA or RNA helicase
MGAVILKYSHGMLIIKGEVPPFAFAKYDQKTQAFRCEAIYYRSVKETLEAKGFEVLDEALERQSFKSFTHTIKLREYQEEAYTRWISAGKRGVIVFPTGAGKTAVAIHAISELSKPTLVVVPTLDLVSQWEGLLKSFGAEVSVLGGGRKEVGSLTVTTYDSASIHYEELGNKFELLVFDEVHHLPAPVFSRIALGSLAPYRMGLTATPEREDGLHSLLPFLVGPVVHSASHEELAGKYLSEYETEVVKVKLSQKEREQYDALMEVYRSTLKKYNIRLRSPAEFQRLVVLSGTNREIRKALLARTEAQKIAFNASGKIEVLRALLERFRGEKVIVFTQFNELVERISREFLIPSITHSTPKDEREEILRRFKEGVYRCIVTSKVLDEGVDVPDASVGIILSGTGSKREYVQRLGRLLRKKDGKVARLIEVVSSGTLEVSTASRRRRVG